MMEALLDTCPMGIFVMRLDVPGDDRTLRVVHANRAVEKHTGTRPADIVGRLCDEAFPTVRQRGFLVRVMRVMGTGEPEAYEDVYYEDERVAAAFGGQVARVAENTVII